MCWTVVGFEMFSRKKDEVKKMNVKSSIRSNSAVLSLVHDSTTTGKFVMTTSRSSSYAFGNDTLSFY